MNIKGYISGLNIDREAIEVASFGDLATSYIPGNVRATLTIQLTEFDGELDRLFNRNEPIEIVIPEIVKGEAAKKPYWRMIRVEDV